VGRGRREKGREKCKEAKVRREAPWRLVYFRYDRKVAL